MKVKPTQVSENLSTMDPSMSETSSDDEFDDSYNENTHKIREMDFGNNVTQPKRRNANGAFKRGAIEDFKSKRRTYQTRKPECFNKSAVMARQNRLRKKMYVENLEQEVGSLKNDNKKLKNMLRKQSGLVKKLRVEENYLRSVIANRTEIEYLLKGFKGPLTTVDNNLSKYPTTTMPQQQNNYSNCSTNDYSLSHFESFQTPESLPDEIFSYDFDNLEMQPNSSIKYVPKEEPTHVSEHNYTSKNQPSVGICLHVTDGKISLEFCSQCHKNATKSEQHPWSENFNEMDSSECNSETEAMGI